MEMQELRQFIVETKKSILTAITNIKVTGGESQTNEASSVLFQECGEQDFDI